MDANLKFISQVLSYPIAWKNLNSTYLGCNLHFSKLFNLNPADIVGKSDAELLWKELNTKAGVTDESAIAEYKEKVYVDYYMPCHDNQYYKFIKMCKEPLFNEENEVSALLMVGEENNYNIYSLINNLFGFNTAPKLSLKLTRREYGILYLLQLGKSVREVAEFISRVENKRLSPATVSGIITHQLYKKFNVRGVTDLLEAANVSGLINHVPAEFMEQFIPIDFV